jgi:hypothetical protein
MSVEAVGVSREWLALREPADAAARAAELVGHVRRHLPDSDRLVIHDLGCGTGAMARWLAPLLPGPQHWVLYDWDADLLDVAGGTLPATAADGTAVSGETRECDITGLGAGELAGASLVTAAALLDMLTEPELDELVSGCAAAGCPVLVTGSVVGRVDLEPEDPLDELVMDAFNAHQRRTTGGRRRLGPDAVGAAVDAFTQLGAQVVVRPSPWRLGPAFGGGSDSLVAQWFTGWVGAACEHRPELGRAAAAYTRRRLAEAAAGRLVVTVHHQDLLVLPR